MGQAVEVHMVVGMVQEAGTVILVAVVGQVEKALAIALDLTPKGKKTMADEGSLYSVFMDELSIRFESFCLYLKVIVVVAIGVTI